MEFYQSVFGGELTLSTFADFHATDDASEQHKIMHAQLETPSGFILMAADTPNYMEFIPGNNYSVSLSGANAERSELSGYWDQLSEGGQIAMELSEAPWGGTFGMCIDRFGTSWLVNIASV